MRLLKSKQTKITYQLFFTTLPFLLMFFLIGQNGLLLKIFKNINKDQGSMLNLGLFCCYFAQISSAIFVQ